MVAIDTMHTTLIMHFVPNALILVGSSALYDLSLEFSRQPYRPKPCHHGKEKCLVAIREAVKTA